MFTRFPILFGLTLSLLLAQGCAKTDTDELSAKQPATKSSAVVSDQPFSPETQDWPHDVSDVATDARVKYGRLENGLRYAVLPVADKNGVISVQLNMDVGFNDEPENLYGIAHLLEHIAFRGKRGEADGSVVHELEEGGVGFGSDLNGFTQADNTFYRLNLTSSGKTSLDDALGSLKTLIDLKELTQENVDAEKRVVLAELKRRDTVKKRAAQSYRAFEYFTNPREVVPGVGTEVSLAAITLADLEAFKATHYLPENAFLVIAGDVDMKDTAGNIKAVFSDWPVAKAGVTQERTPEAQTILPPLDHTAFREARSQVQLNAVEHRPFTPKADSFESRKRTVKNRLVTAMLESRIDRRVEAETKVSWINLVQRGTKDHDLIGVKMAADDLPLAMAIFEEERRKAVEFGFTPEEIKYAVTKKRARFVRMDASTDTINAWYEANNIRTRFVRGTVYNSTAQELTIFDEITDGLSLEDYNLAARDMWAEFNPKYWTQSSKPMSETVKAVKAARVAAADLGLSAPDFQSNDRFQKTEMNGIGQVKSRDVVRANKTHRLLFDNGVRLNYKVSGDDPDKIVVVVALREPDGEMVETNYAAISEKVRSLSRADIKDANAFNMDRQFVGIETNFSLFLNEDRLFLFLSTTPDALEDGLDLMSSFLISFDPASKDYQRKFEAQVKTWENAGRESPVVEGLLELTFAYSGKSSAVRSMSANSFVIDSKINAHIDDVLKSGSVEVGVVGDFDADRLEAVFAASLGAIPSRPDVTTAPVVKNEDVTLLEPGVSTLTYNGSADQMALFYCQPEPAETATSEFSELYLLSTIAQSRLHDNLRNELGISYSPQVYRQSNRVFPNSNFACLYAQFDPANEVPAHDSFRRVISSFNDTPITKAELKRAREPMLSAAKRYGESNNRDAIFMTRAYSEPELSVLSKVQSESIKTLRGVKLKTLNARARAHYDLSSFHVFRVQHYQNLRTIRKNTLEIESHLGEATSQLEVGKFLLRSPEKSARERGLKLLNEAGAQGLKEAYYEIGNFHSKEFGSYTYKVFEEFSDKDLKAVADAYELSGPLDKTAYRLASIYLFNYDVFPDVEDAHIIKLARQSAESGDAKGQLFLAERLKDGTLVKRDEVGALKWALISNHSKTGALSIEDDRGVARFITGLPKADVETAQAQAESWVSRKQN